ncbi:uncharacterized protein METZ01_LOCUS314880, partial [marine metagenome]
MEADAAIIEFTSIPQTYEHLQLRISCKQSQAADSIDIELRLGTGGGAVDSGTNYWGDRMSAYKTTLAPSSGGNRNVAKYATQFAAGSNYDQYLDECQYGCGVVDILDYANSSKNTTIIGHGGTALGGGYPWVHLGSGLWNNTGALDRI